MSRPEAEAAVRAWRDALAALDPSEHLQTALSPQGLRAVWDVALDALSDEALEQAWRSPGVPWRHATLVVARTVVTAPLEWAAVLLGRGTEVLLKVPAEAPEVGQLLATVAGRAGLPLRVTAERAAVVRSTGAPRLVVAMGSDATIDTLRDELPAEARFLGFGHRYSVAWAPSPDELREAAVQIALHDTRGCRSPVAVFSEHPDAVAVLAEAMEEAEGRWPLGRRSDHEAAKLRARQALARVVGSATDGPGWAVLALPVERFVPEALPRVAVVHTGGAEALARAVAPTREHLSVIGVGPQGRASDALRALSAHVVPLATMQRPPVHRRHDGVDWVAATLR